MTNTVVIGAGVFGAWCAWWLADAGHRVTLVDAYGVAHGRASSGDHSRVIRSGYGDDAIYSRWATSALDDWRRLEQETGQRLFVRSGALFLGPPEDGYVRATAETLGRLGVAAERLDPAAIHRRFPQIAVDGLGAAVLEADAGVLRARAAVQALVGRLVETDRVRYRAAHVAPLDESRPQPHLVTASGDGIGADVVVCACGPWLPSLLPQAIGRRIRPTRQEVLYFGVPAGDSAFALPALPVWIDFGAGAYGIPDLDGYGFKVGVDRHGPPIDPDTADRLIGPEVVSATRVWLARRFPRLADAPLVEARVCQYENSSTGDFIIDRHPAWENVWIAGGGSGHGFKHGPSVGRHVAALIEGRASVEPRFALAGKTAAAARAVF